MMTAREILEAAADQIARTGWCTGSYAEKNGHPVHFEGADDTCKFCAEGAIRFVANYKSWTRDIGQYNSMYEALKTVSQHVQFPVTSWNDMHAKDGEQVVDVLRAAAKRL
jgi:hypothetical protein